MGILRLSLAICVIIAHTRSCYGFRPLGGPEAVQTFYIISGFYMAMILNEKYRGPGSYRAFLTNRFLRIYPIYWIIAAVTAASALFFTLYSHRPGLMELHGWIPVQMRAALVGSNIAIFGQSLVYFIAMRPDGKPRFTHNFIADNSTLHFFHVVPQAWSLEVELLFYLIAPLLVRRRVRTIAMVMLASIALRLYIYFQLGWTNDPWTYRFFPTELALFLAGAVGFRLLRRIPERRLSRALLWAVALFFFACFIGYQFAPAWQFRGVVLKPWVFYIIAWAAIPLLFSISKNSRIDRYIGELSYPVYVVHMLGFACFTRILPATAVDTLLPFVVIVFSVVVSMGLIHWVSNPIERIRQRRIACANFRADRMTMVEQALLPVSNG